MQIKEAREMLLLSKKAFHFTLPHKSSYLIWREREKKKKRGGGLGHRRERENCVEMKKKTSG